MDKQTEWVMCPKCRNEYNKLWRDDMCYECWMKLQKWGEVKEAEPTFDNFIVDDSNKAVFEQTQRFLHKDNNQGLYLWGKSGRGKTHLCMATIKAARLHGHCEFGNMPEVLLEIRASYNLQSDFSELEIIEKYANCDYLFIDDIKDPKEHCTDILYKILNIREREQRGKVFITSNHHIKEISKVDDRISSRIVGLCGRDNILELKGKDWRVKK
ncbi:unnamed protein product [marine sediment metagenome]|uniref:Chromosomal replication initiator protein DnaA ATPAse domain-containing protein n=1 Tax=marine sediment metagenome TaxID=412755 RepID=X0XCP1_9ZZZZ